MSGSKNYVCAAIPDEKSADKGALKVARCIDASDERHARAKCSLLFIEDYPGAQDAAYKFLICEWQEGIPHPGFTRWNEEFMYAYDWNEELNRPVEKQTYAPEPVNFEKLPTENKIAALVMYGHDELTTDLLPATAELINEDERTFEGYVVEAICKTPEIASMSTERILNAIGWVSAKCDPSAKWPAIKAELISWKKRLEADRKLTGREKSVVDIAREKAAAEKIKNIPAPVLLQDQDSLKRNIALGLVAKAMDFDILNPPASIMNRAREIIRLKQKPFPAWLECMTKTQGIYEYSNVQIIYSVKISAPDIEKTPGAIQGHINRTFTETDHQNPSSEMLAIACGKQQKKGSNDEAQQNATESTDSLDSSASTTGAVEQKQPGDEAATGPLEDTPPVERTGPFYFLLADGEKFGRANKLAGLQKALAGGGKEISQEEYQARKNGTYQTDVDSGDREAAQVVKQLAAQRREYVECVSDPAEPKWAPGKNEVKTTVAASEPHTSFTVRADELEKELGDSENLSLWRSVMRTNPRYTKDMGDLGFGGTSINAEYMIMRATEMFGPVGRGWGWKVLEDKMLEGGPLTEKIFEGNKFVGKRTLRDADGSLINELNHYLKIELWYLSDGERASIESYGSTIYRQTTKNGIYCDSEVHKKSLTDAIKKALSTLGFSADVWLGLYDDAVYKAESKLEFEIKDASDKADDTARIREELDERFKGNVETMRKAVTQNEVSKIASSLTRTVAVHLKSAKETGDSEYVKYLEGRLRRLEEVKVECLKNLEEKA